MLRIPSDDAALAVTGSAHALMKHGFVHVIDGWPSRDAAWRYAMQVFAKAAEGDPLTVVLPELGVVGEFTVPPRGVVQRPFQALHIDFGLPLGTRQPVDVARFTALFVDVEFTCSEATTRIVPLTPLLSQRSWPDRPVIAEQLRSSASGGRSVEGVLGRIVEIADESSSLPPLDSPGFLCGMEFATLDEELSYFNLHGLRVADVAQHIVVRPGELLVFDNLRVAHGRSGERKANELHQLCVGYQSLDAADQAAVLDRTLAAFAS
jgi:hypothetical protein